MIDPMTKREVVSLAFMFGSLLLMILVHEKGKDKEIFLWVGILALLLSYAAGVIAALS